MRQHVSSEPARICRRVLVAACCVLLLVVPAGATVSQRQAHAADDADSRGSRKARAGSGTRDAFPVFLAPADGEIVTLRSLRSRRESESESNAGAGGSNEGGGDAEASARQDTVLAVEVLVVHWAPQRYAIVLDVNDARVEPERVAERVNRYAFAPHAGGYYVLTAKLLCEETGCVGPACAASDTRAWVQCAEAEVHVAVHGGHEANTQLLADTRLYADEFKCTDGAAHEDGGGARDDRRALSVAHLPFAVGMWHQHAMCDLLHAVIRRKHRQDELDRYMRARLGLALTHRGAVDAGVHNLVTAVVGGDAALDSALRDVAVPEGTTDAPGSVAPAGREVAHASEPGSASVVESVEVVTTALVAHATLGSVFLDRASDSQPRTSGPRQAVLRAVALRHLSFAADTYDALLLDHGVDEWSANGASAQQRGAHRIATDAYVLRRVLDAHFFSGSLHAGAHAASTRLQSLPVYDPLHGGDTTVYGREGSTYHAPSTRPHHACAAPPHAWTLRTATQARVGPTVTDTCCRSRQGQRAQTRRHARHVRWLGGELPAQVGLFGNGSSWDNGAAFLLNGAGARPRPLARAPRAPRSHRTGTRAAFHLQRYLHWVARAADVRTSNGRRAAHGTTAIDDGASSLDGGVHATATATGDTCTEGDRACGAATTAPWQSDTSEVGSDVAVMGLHEDAAGSHDSGMEGGAVGEQARVSPTAFDAHMQLGALFGNVSTALRAHAASACARERGVHVQRATWTRKAVSAWRVLALESLRLVAPLTQVLNGEAPTQAPLLRRHALLRAHGSLLPHAVNVSVLDAAGVRHLAAAVALRPTSLAALRALDAALCRLGASALPQAALLLRRATDAGVLRHPLQRPWRSWHRALPSRAWYPAATLRSAAQRAATRMQANRGHAHASDVGAEPLEHVVAQAVAPMLSHLQGSANDVGKEAAAVARSGLRFTAASHGASACWDGVKPGDGGAATAASTPGFMPVAGIVGMQRGPVHNSAATTAGDGSCGVYAYPLRDHGYRVATNEDRMPTLASLLTTQSFASAAACVTGTTTVLALLPGAHLPSRTAATNLQLRVGMVLGSLQLDDGGERGERGRTHAEAALRGVAPCHAATSSTCGQPTPCAMLRVGSRLRAWRSGEPFVFDPSFEHEMRNGGNETVLLLLMDVWHPVLSTAQRWQHLDTSQQRRLGDALVGTSPPAHVQVDHL